LPSSRIEPSVPVWNVPVQTPLAKSGQAAEKALNQAPYSGPNRSFQPHLTSLCGRHVRCSCHGVQKGCGVVALLSNSSASMKRCALAPTKTHFGGASLPKPEQVAPSAGGRL